MSRNKLILISIAATALASVISLEIFYAVRTDPRVAGDLTPRDVRDLQRMASSLRDEHYRSQHPYGSETLVGSLICRARGLTVRMEIMEKPSAVSDMACVVYRDRFDTNRTYVYYFKAQGTNGWKFSSSRESL
jgi:hypothetical protein